MAKPQSTTKRTPSSVIEVSAIDVATITLRPGALGPRSKTRAWRCCGSCARPSETECECECEGEWEGGIGGTTTTDDGCACAKGNLRDTPS